MALSVPRRRHVNGKRDSYLWHDGSPIFALDISKGHLRTFVLVDLELGMVEIGDLVDRYCAVASVLKL